MSSSCSSETLELVHVIFRHGDRTNTKVAVYPNDPHINETYAPYGHGELTKKGKRRMYKVGTALRKRYDKFLGSSYHPDLLEAVSTDSNRTKSSLSLVLAGLFPPINEEIWEEGINWQPIPFSNTPMHLDKTFFAIYDRKYKHLIQEHYASPEVIEELSIDEQFLNKLSYHTGLPIVNYDKVFFLYITLQIEEEFGLELPSWTKEIYPHPLREIALKHYLISTATTPMRQLVIGRLLEKIVVNLKNKSDKLLEHKLILYSGHEFHIAYFLATLNIFEPHIPPYGSYIVIELHRINDTTCVRLLYQDYNSEEPQVLRLRDCEEYCSLEKFISIVEEYFPAKEDP